MFFYSLFDSHVNAFADSEKEQKVIVETVKKDNHPKSLRISIIKGNAPFSVVLPNGKPAGLYVDIWKEWSKVTGVKVEFVQSDLVVDVEQLRNGEVDIHSGLFINEERESWASFSLPIDKVDTALFFNGDTSQTLAISQMYGKKIGVNRGAFQEEYLRVNYPEIEVVSFVRNEEMINQLLDNKIDAIVAEVPQLQAALSKMGINGALTRDTRAIFSNTVHALIPDHNKYLIPLINQGIKNLPLDTIINLGRKWLPRNPSYFESLSKAPLATLTIAEQQWLSENKHLILGIDESWRPFEYVGPHGEYSGIVSEYVELVSELLSIELIPEFGNSWDNVITKAKSRELDILPGVEPSEEDETFLSFSNPYLEFGNVVVAKKNSPFVLNMNGLKGRKIATVRGYNITTTLQNEFPDILLTRVENINEGLNLVETGEVFGYIDNIADITHNINLDNRDNLSIAYHTAYTDKLTFGVRRGLEPLVPIINKALNEITEKQRNEIVNRWLSVRVNVGTDILTMLQWGIPTFLMLAVVIAIVMRSNTRMQKEIVRRRNSETSLKEATLAAEIAKTNAEKANQGKNEFLANVSHEIRTPMNAIIGSAHLLEQSGIDKAQQSYLDILKLSANTLLSLINDTLDWSKIEAGKIELENHPIALYDLVSNLVKQAELSLYHSSESRNKSELTISSNINSQVPQLIMGDQLRLSQILLNLLNNAIKFTESGTIDVELFIEHEKNNKLCMHFIVSDTGIGMTLKQTERLFKTYSQVDASTSRKYGGTGLGLSICKNLSQLMQGHIWVESRLGEGSQFHFTCMLNTVDEVVLVEGKKKLHREKSLVNSSQQKDSESDNSLKGKKILIVDDNQVNSIIAKKILANRGLISHMVTSGTEAINKIKESKFDCVLMDIQMPEMDGYQTTQKIRQGDNSADIPIIGLSANISEDDVSKGLAVGMNDYLGKPIDPQKMFEALSEQFA